MGVNHDEEYQWSERPKSNVFIKSSSGLILTLQDLPFNSSCCSNLIVYYNPRIPRYE